MKNLKISDFSYILPDEKIAKYPLSKRDESKLLVYKNGNIEQSKFNKIDNFLAQDSLIIVNNTKVIYARIIFQKTTGSKIEIFCLNPFIPKEYNLAFTAKNECEWECIVGNSKKWKNDELILKFEHNNNNYNLKASKIKEYADKKIIKFKWDGDYTFSEVLNIIGEVPIPPYLNRKSEENDKKTYQTVYSKIEGSVAAPTAGLHFTDEIFEKLKNKNIQKAEVTLHVGAGTFKPVKSENVDEHEMHTEFFYITKEALKKILTFYGKITSVGTTSLRALESIYWIGVKLLTNKENFNYLSQKECYELPEIDTKQVIVSLIEYLEKNKLEYIAAHTQIIIVPGYKFKIADVLITNFHQPQSTLLLLVGAFIGDDWKKVYEYALNNDFRFLSYGDSSILEKKTN